MTAGTSNRTTRAAFALAVLLLSAPAFAAKMPTLIRINGVAWAVKLADHDAFDKASQIGNTDCSTRTILILRDLAPWDKAEVIMHEVQHAFTCDNNLVHNDRLNNDGIVDHCDGHCGIYFAGPKWHQLMRDNPDLIRYIHDTDPPPDPDVQQAIQQYQIPR